MFRTFSGCYVLDDAKMARPSWSLSIEELAAIGMQVIDTWVILVCKSIGS